LVVAEAAEIASEYKIAGVMPTVQQRRVAVGLVVQAVGDVVREVDDREAANVRRRAVVIDEEQLVVA